MQNLTCTNINKTLSQISQDSSQLWGLSYSNNSIYCDFTYQFAGIFTFTDFESNLTNPLYQSEVGTNSQDLNQVFLPVCYAYSILRIFMVSSVAIYVIQKMKEIFKQSQNFPKEKRFELQFYKGMMIASLILEIICGGRDFFLFKGTLLYSNLMNEDPVQCYVDIYNNGSMVCNTTDSTYLNNWRKFSYDRSDCNCLYYEPSQQTPYMKFNIVIWIITESLTQGLTLLTVHILSRLNKMEKSGWKFIKPSLIKTSLQTIFLIILYTLLIFLFDIRLYYRFLNIGVVGFYLFQKSLIFIVIFERLYSKIWLELKLRLPTLHASGIAWSKTLLQLKRQLKKNIVIPEEIQEQNKEKYKQEYQKNLDEYYNDTISPITDQYEKEYNAKMQTQWYDYLNYILTINLIGIVGYIFIFSYWLQNSYHKGSALFWIGFILALIELIVFEVSNVVFQLHCFLIELYKQCKQELSALETGQESGISALNI